MTHRLSKVRQTLHAEILPPLLTMMILVGEAGAQSKGQRPKVPATAHKAILAFLREEGGPEREAPKEGRKTTRKKADEKALEKAIRACRKRLDIAAEALRTLPPLTRSKPGAKHGLEFRSGDKDWEYSIRLPKGYDNKKRFPVLVLPDHGSVNPKAGISYWEQSKLVEKFILFRPVIIKYQQDKERFPRRQFFDRDIDIAKVMRDALRHLKLHYAVDHDRLFMTGLSQAGYYSYYYAVSFPDLFAGIVPESAGGMALRASVALLARNLKSVRVRILHAKGDQIVPYDDAKLMERSLERVGAQVELISFDASDYRRKNPKQHPTPHHLRIGNILPWCLAQPPRTLPTSIDRVLRYPQQGQEGRFRIPSPTSWKQLTEVHCSAKDGILESNLPGVIYLVSPEEILSKQSFKLDKKRLRPKADLKLLFRSFKAMPDPRRLVAAEIPIPHR